MDTSLAPYLQSARRRRAWIHERDDRRGPAPHHPRGGRRGRRARARARDPHPERLPRDRHRRSVRGATHRGRRAGVVDVLTLNGYHVTDTGDPFGARRMWERQPVQLLLTDVVMPIMNGLEL